MSWARPALLQPAQLAKIRSLCLVFFAPLFKLGAELFDARQNLLLDTELNAGKKLSERHAKERGESERRSERREAMAFFISGYLRAILRTQQESYLALRKARSPAV